jgi:undecaprenyl-diphosphatase
MLAMDAGQRQLITRATPLLAASLAASLVGLLLFSWLAEEVFTGEMQSFDLAVRLALHQHASPGLTRIMSLVSWLGSAAVLTPAVLALAALFLWLRWRRAAAWLLISMLGAVTLEVTLKSAFHRTRPSAFFGTLPPSFSFPSGHALSSFCFYSVLAGLLSRRIRGRGKHVALWAVAAIMVTLTGISRIYLGVHWPTDVIAGYCAAAVWVSGLLAGDRWRLHRKTRKLAPEVPP